MRKTCNKLFISFLAALLLITQAQAFTGFVGAPSSSAIPIIPRNVASGVRVQGFAAGGVSNGTDTSANTRSLHVNESGQSLTSLALVYTGWYMENANSPNNGAEACLPNNYTVYASVEYPLGTYQQVTWGGSSSSVIPTCGNIVSDYLQLSTAIPRGAQFAVRTYTTVTSGGIWGTASALASGETGNNGTPANETLGGTITGTYSGVRPSAILSVVPGGNKVSLAGMGDSILAGSGDGGYDSDGNTGFLGRAATGNAPFIDIAVIGTTLAQQIGNFTNRTNFLKVAGITHVVLEYGINDGATSTPAQMEANANSLATSISNAGAKVYETTLTPEASSTFKWLTTASQTASTNNTTNNTFSTWVTTIPAPLSGYIDNRTAVGTSFTSGIWKAGNSQTAYLEPNTDNWTASGTPTTTNVPSNNTNPTHYYQFGTILFTSGVDSGLSVEISDNTTSTFTLVAGLPSAPAAGDTFNAYPFGAAATGDGTHAGNFTSASGSFGGVFILKNNMIPVIQGWLQ